MSDFVQIQGVDSSLNSVKTCEPNHNPENISEPDHNLENMFEPDQNPENMCEPDHNLENISEPHHNLENICKPYLYPENMCKPEQNSEKIGEPNHSPEKICEPNQNPEKICESNHNLENIFESYHNPENICEPDHNLENICEPDLNPENICEPDLNPGNICEPNHNQEKICEPKENPEEIDQNCDKSHLAEKFENFDPEPEPASCQRTAPVHFVKLKFMRDTRIPRIKNIIKGSSSLKKIVSNIKPCSDVSDCKSVDEVSIDQDPEPSPLSVSQDPEPSPPLSSSQDPDSSPPLSSSQNQSKPKLVKIDSESQMRKTQAHSLAKNTEHFLKSPLDIKLDSIPEHKPALKPNQDPVKTKYPKKALIVKFVKDHKIIRIKNISDKNCWSEASRVGFWKI